MMGGRILVALDCHIRHRRVMTAVAHLSRSIGGEDIAIADDLGWPRTQRSVLRGFRLMIVDPEMLPPEWWEAPFEPTSPVPPQNRSRWPSPESDGGVVAGFRLVPTLAYLRSEFSTARRVRDLLHVGVRDIVQLGECDRPRDLARSIERLLDVDPSRAALRDFLDSSLPTLSDSMKLGLVETSEGDFSIRTPREVLARQLHVSVSKLHGDLADAGMPSPGFLIRVSRIFRALHRIHLGWNDQATAAMHAGYPNREAFLAAVRRMLGPDAIVSDWTSIEATLHQHIKDSLRAPTRNPSHKAVRTKAG